MDIESGLTVKVLNSSITCRKEHSREKINVIVSEV
jgi:hypothetical protein